MRNTLTIQDALLRKAEQTSSERNFSVGNVAEEAMRLTFGAPAKGRPSQRRKLETFCGAGLQPGVDIASSVSLLTVMEGR